MSAAFRQLLLERYLAWQRDVAKKAMPQAAYAKYLKISPGAFSNYLNGKRVPRTEEEQKKLADKLGEEVYDALDVPRPDPRLRFIIRKWGSLPDGVREELRATVERALARAGDPQPNRARVEVPERR